MRAANITAGVAVAVWFALALAGYNLINGVVAQAALGCLQETSVRVISEDRPYQVAPTHAAIFHKSPIPATSSCLPAARDLRLSPAPIMTSATSSLSMLKMIGSPSLSLKFGSAPRANSILAISGSLTWKKTLLR
jgi:hypothetical protein